MFNLSIAIDDVNPHNDFKLIGTNVEKYLFELNKRFGVKFDLFIPANYEGNNKLSENKEWFNDLKSIPFFSLEAHGYLHQCTDNRFGMCEFYELNYEPDIINRINLINEEWLSVQNEIPLIWRNPGWLCSENSKKFIEKNFKGVALHYSHNMGFKWNCKEFFGHDGIETNSDNIHIHNGNMIMLQSHIFGEWNDNSWNDYTYNNVTKLLDVICENYQINFVNLKDCL